ncbi:tyrosine-type recombinase/integrase [Methylotetracoccus oryzae]|uniref:tyrosine-type recombinase/integrase n=1 Tax=Methylotetracoccus oryzae TaxID=1919059 RepID=UPI001119DC2B
MERDPVYQNDFELAFITGLRISELIARQWGDIDWRRRTVTVHRARVRRESKVTTTAVIREVELHRRALDALRRQKALSLLESCPSPLLQLRAFPVRSADAPSQPSPAADSLKSLIMR